MKRVLCISECCLDLIFAGLSRVPEPGEELYGSDFAMKAGGGANTAIVLAQLGVPVTYLTDFADDRAGEILREALTKAGVQIIRPAVHPERTAVSAILSRASDGERAIASFSRSAGGILDPAVLEPAIREADIVHTYSGYACHSRIPEFVRSLGKELSVDFSYDDARSESAGEVLSLCDYVKMNREEALTCTGLGTPEEALRMLSRKVRKAAVITLGQEGSIGAEAHRRADGCKDDAGCREEIHAEPACGSGRLVDTCGAGDAYAAGFLSAISEGLSFPKAMQRGSETAGRSVSWLGGNDPEFHGEGILNGPSDTLGTDRGKASESAN